MSIIFRPTAWEQYVSWQRDDKAILKKINTLIKECLRRPFEGRGKPELLKRELSGYGSRRITREHRLVYRFENDELIILQCRYHY